MAIDAAAVARVLGISTEFRDLRESSILYLPQRIAVLAQGSTDAVYSTDKYQVTSSAAAGNRFGYGSPAHLIVQQLLPPNGDGVGTIPVTVYPLADHGSGAAAAGTITPSGTQTTSASYRVNVNNILSEAFTVAAGATLAAKLWAMYEAVNAVLSMPVLATLTYGTVTAGSLVGTGNGTLTSLSVDGTPKPGVYSLVVNTVVAHGGVWTLTDADGVVVADDITMTPGVGVATVINVGDLEFTLTDGTTDFGLGASFAITVPATVMNLTSKWKGVSANDIAVSVEGEDYGTTFTVVQPTGGLNNPSVTAALAQMGNVWETMVLNALNLSDTTTLGLINTHGEGRWGQLVRKPYVAFTGCTDAAVADATAVSTARRTDRVNAQLVSPGSSDLPFVVAARQLARIAVVAANNPPTDYGSQRATGLTPGADGSQWDYPTRDQAVKAGSSTVEVRDGVVCLGDTITFYRPTGEEPPAYRYVCDIVKLQNALFNTDLIFAAPGWDGAPLIPDDQPTVNPLARKPKHAKAQVAAMIDALALAAIISDPAAAKASITAAINSSNPKRLDVSFTIKLSGNANIIDVTLAFGFYVGVQAAA
jgi:phage tail sheath gpL-like